MRPAELFAPQRKEEPKLLRGMRQGLGYVRRTPAIRLILLMTMVVSTVGFNFNVLIPVLAGKTLHGGPVVFGALGASFGLGALAGALLSASMARASRRMLLVGGAGFSSALLVLAPISVVWGAAVLLFFIGFFFVAWTSNSQSVLQLTSPDHLRGRVLSIYLFAFGGFAPLGGLLSGWLADIGGTPLAFSVAGLSCLAVTGYAALRWPRASDESARARPTAEPEEQLAA